MHFIWPRCVGSPLTLAPAGSSVSDTARASLRRAPRLADWLGHRFGHGIGLVPSIQKPESGNFSQKRTTGFRLYLQARHELQWNMAGSLSWKPVSNCKCVWQNRGQCSRAVHNVNGCISTRLLRHSCHGKASSVGIGSTSSNLCNLQAVPLQCNVGMTTLFVKSLQRLPSLHATVLSISSNICLTVCTSVQLMDMFVILYTLQGHIAHSRQAGRHMAM